jgi:hypothetical protein
MSDARERFPTNSGILSLFASVVMRVIVIADDGIQ